MKKTIIIIILSLIGILLGSYFYSSRSKKPAYDSALVKKGNLSQEVSVTGRVRAAEEVELAFEKSGRVDRVLVKTGDKVRNGATLVVLENRDLSAQLLQAQAALETEQAKLSELKRGTRSEEIQAAETEVANAERSLQDAKTDLENVKNKAEVDLNNVYDAALTASQKAVNAGKSALLTFTDLQYQYYTSTDADSSAVADAKNRAVLLLLGATNGGRFTTNQLSTLNGGAFGAVQIAIDEPTFENTDKAILQTLAALREVKKMLHLMPITTSFTSTQKTNLETEKTTINTEITTLSAKQQAIAVQKVTNANNIATTEAGINTAQNTLASAQDDLNLKKAGTVPEQIAAQEAKVKSALANVENYEAQLAKTILRSPFRGIVTKQNAKAGEIATANASLVSLISEANFEIEANIPEADIAKVKIGNIAKVTLDAYGAEAVFEVKVSQIDPAETIIEGVPTYKTTLQFTAEDERLKTGMTANIDILTAKWENVIIIPQRAVVAKNGEKIVKVLIASGKSEEIKEVKVKTGLRGSDGNIEIIEGISEGDRVVVFIKE